MNPIAAAARSLSTGDVLGALNRIALLDDPAALALRGIAMARLGEPARARNLLRRAARGFDAHHALARARCLVADAEIALAMRDLAGSPRATLAAAACLEAGGDLANALQARLVVARRLLLLGRLDAAASALDSIAAPLATIESSGALPALAAVAARTIAELAMRSVQVGPAEAALARAHDAARRAAIPALQAEVQEACAALERPAARISSAGQRRTLRLAEVAALRASGRTMVLDGCRRALHADGARIALARRPVLFALERTLAEAWPGDAGRSALILQAFRITRPDDTHRARLRVEIGRLRRLVVPLADITATASGFALTPRGGRDVVAVLVPPIDGDAAALGALLADGAAWPTVALALALGESQRTVQRALAELEARGQVRCAGRARAKRWLATPNRAVSTILLLPKAWRPDDRSAGHAPSCRSRQGCYSRRHRDRSRFR